MLGYWLSILGSEHVFKSVTVIQSIVICIAHRFRILITQQLRVGFSASLDVAEIHLGHCFVEGEQRLDNVN